MELDKDNIRNLNDLNEIIKFSFKNDIVSSSVNNQELDIIIQKPSIKKLLKFLGDLSLVIFA